MKVADLLETKRPRLIVQPNWKPEDVKYYHMDGGIQVVMPITPRPKSLLDVSETSGPSPRYVAREVINKLLELNEKGADYEIEDDMREPIHRFENNVRLHGAFLVKNAEESLLKELMAKCFESQVKLKQANLDLERKKQIYSDKRFMKDLLDPDADLKEAKTPSRKMTPEECDRLGRIYDDLERFGLTDRLPSKPSSQVYMNQLLIKLSAGDIYVNPFFGADNDFKIKIRFNPDLRHAKMSIGDLYDGDPATYKKLKMRAKLADNQISVIEVLEEAVKVCKREGASKFVAWVYGADEVNDFEEQEADKKIEELVRLHGNGVFQIEAVWKS